MTWEIQEGDCLAVLCGMESESVQTCVTSPPYWGLRDYGVEGQLGLESTPEQYVENLVAVMREVRRVLRRDGTLWLNLGDSYAGGFGQTGRNDTDRETPGGRGGSFRGGERLSVVKTHGLKPKDLVGIPWRVAFALQADGWWLRSDIIWSKPNPMPESVTDRPTRAHEYIFLLTKSQRYFYDADAIREPHVFGGQRETNGAWAQDEAGRPGADGAQHLYGHPAGRNRRSVWEITTQPYPEAHFATFPPKLIEPCILAGSAMSIEGLALEDQTDRTVVLDPFAGSGTTGVVALRHDRSFVGVELNPEYVELARNRIRDDAPLFNVETETV